MNWKFWRKNYSTGYSDGYRVGYSEGRTSAFSATPRAAEPAGDGDHPRYEWPPEIIFREALIEDEVRDKCRREYRDELAILSGRLAAVADFENACLDFERRVRRSREHFGVPKT
jgi:hypothetical protein